MFGFKKRGRPEIEVRFTEVPRELSAAERSLAVQLGRIAAVQRVVVARLGEQMELPVEERDTLMVLALLDVQAALAVPPVVPGRSR